MDYLEFEPDRYRPDLPTALRNGLADLESIHEMVGPDRDQSILDIGCGCGSLLLALREQGYVNCVGLEISQDLQEYGKQTFGVDIHLGDWLSYLESSDETLDVIIALDVLEHLNRDILGRVLTASRNRLAPGGRLILRMPNALCPFALPTLYGDLTHQFLMVPKTLEYLLRGAGFEGPVSIKETRPGSTVKRVLFTLAHVLVVKPLVSVLYFHFHGELPSHITPNIICCAKASTGERNERS